MLTRRGLAGASAVAVAGAAAPAIGAAPRDRRFRVKQHARVIVDNDFAGDPDGLVAAAHQLLSPATEVRALTSTAVLPDDPFIRRLAAKAVFKTGQDAAAALLDAMDLPRPPPAHLGATTAMEPGRAQRTQAALAIVEEAMRSDDQRPLYVTCGGALTNIASALLIEPRIAERMTVVWIGGAAHSKGGAEFNMGLDVEAAKVVFNESPVPLWQFTVEMYRDCALSVAELEAEVRPLGRAGAWLYDQFTTLGDLFEVGEVWPMGDSPLVLATALSSESSRFAEGPKPRLNDDMTYAARTGPAARRVYTRIDFRLIVGDFLAKLKLHAGRTRA